MLTLTSLASSSSGNCYLVSDGTANVLIDAGISCQRIKNALAAVSVTPDMLSAVLITHEHSDHIAGLATLTKHFDFPIYASKGTAGQLYRQIAFLDDRLVPFTPGSSLEIGPLHIGTFPLSHDAAEPAGFLVESGGRRMVMATDLGVATRPVIAAASSADLLVLEANHDVELLRAGPYPLSLKQRILGDRGHLSNAAAGALACAAVAGGARTLLLAHLSRQNNTPRLARDTVSAALRLITANPGSDLCLDVLDPDAISATYTV